MTSKNLTRIASAGLVLMVAACGGQLTHVKPGNSARAYLEAKNAPAAVPVTVSKPGSLPIPAGSADNGVSSANAAAIPPLPLPEIPGDPGLPDRNNNGEKVADLFTRATSALRAGQTGEAILALEETVKLDPAFADAWSKLAAAYSKAGQNAKAIEAYKMAKKLGQQGGTTGTGEGLIR